MIVKGVNITNIKQFENSYFQISDNLNIILTPKKDTNSAFINLLHWCLFGDKLYSTGDNDKFKPEIAKNNQSASISVELILDDETKIWLCREIYPIAKREKIILIETLKDKESKLYLNNAALDFIKKSSLPSFKKKLFLELDSPTDYFLKHANIKKIIEDIAKEDSSNKLIENFNEEINGYRQSSPNLNAITAIKREIKSKKENIVNLKRDIDNFKLEINKLTSKIELVDKYILDINELTNFDNETKTLKREYEDLKAQLNNCENEIKEFTFKNLYKWLLIEPINYTLSNQNEDESSLPEDLLEISKTVKPQLTHIKNEIYGFPVIYNKYNERFYTLTGQSNNKIQELINIQKKIDKFSNISVEQLVQLKKSYNYKIMDLKGKIKMANNTMIAIEKKIPKFKKELEIKDKQIKLCNEKINLCMKEIEKISNNKKENIINTKELFKQTINKICSDLLKKAAVYKFVEIDDDYNLRFIKDDIEFNEKTKKEDENEFLAIALILSYYELSETEIPLILNNLISKIPEQYRAIFIKSQMLKDKKYQRIILTTKNLVTEDVKETIADLNQDKYKIIDYRNLKVEVYNND